MTDRSTEKLIQLSTIQREHTALLVRFARRQRAHRSSHVARLASWILPRAVLGHARQVASAAPVTALIPAPRWPAAQQYYFLHHYLRLVVLQLQELLAHRSTLGKINASTAIITNSLRRGGSTAAANAGVTFMMRDSVPLA